MQKSDYAPAKKEITSIRRIQIDVIVAYFYKVVNEKILLLVLPQLRAVELPLPFAMQHNKSNTQNPRTHQN